MPHLTAVLGVGMLPCTWIPSVSYAFGYGFRYEAIYPTRLFCSLSDATLAAASSSPSFYSSGAASPSGGGGGGGGGGRDEGGDGSGGGDYYTFPSWPPSTPQSPLEPPSAPLPPQGSNVGFCSSCLTDCLMDSDSAEGSCLQSCGLPPVAAFPKVVEISEICQGVHRSSEVQVFMS